MRFSSWLTGFYRGSPLPTAKGEKRDRQNDRRQAILTSNFYYSRPKMIRELLVRTTTGEFEPHLTPFLKWAGGKSWLAELLNEVWKHYNHYCFVDPFCGSLALPLALNPKKAILNDYNAHLINLYQQIANGFTVSLKVRNSESYYYARRAEFNKLIARDRHLSPRAAELYIYINRAGYNGLSRFNQKGFCNVPRGRYKRINLRKEFTEYQSAFRRWRFTNADFTSIQLRKNQFLYLDPPYHGNFTKYTGNGFTWDDQVRMVKWAAKHQGPVIISNSYNEDIINLYQEYGFEVVKVMAPRHISRDPAKRKKVPEVLAYKNL